MLPKHCPLTAVSCNLLPPPTAVSTQSKITSWCNSHFIHCTKIEVGDGVWGYKARHWVSGVRGGSPSPVLHRVTSDHLTRSQCWSAPSDSDLACFIQCHHWHTTISGWRYIYGIVKYTKQCTLHWLPCSLNHKQNHRMRVWWPGLPHCPKTWYIVTSETMWVVFLVSRDLWNGKGNEKKVVLLGSNIEPLA